MFVIGLTGSIAMGKTTTARLFADEGVPVHDADAAVHKLYAGEAAGLIEVAFPGSTRNGTVDRVQLGKQVTGDPTALRRLEEIVHPLVRNAERKFLRDAEIGQHDADRALHRGQRAQPVQDWRRDEAEHLGVDAHRHLRRMGGLGEDVHHLADPVRLGIGQVKALPVEPFLVREVVERIGNEIHRHDVDSAALDADRRHPRRQHFAHLLDGLEEIVRAIDLVDFTGLRMTDDEAGAVDAERNLGLVADHAFRIVLGLEIGVIEIFGLVEHVLAEHAVVKTGGRDRAHVLETARVDRRGELDRVARSLDVGDLLILCGCGQVVDGGEMEEVVDLSLQLFQVGVRNAEILFREIALNRLHELLAAAPLLAQRIEFLLRSLANQNVDGLAALDEVGDEKTADEAGRAGDEVRHVVSPSYARRALPAVRMGSGCRGAQSRRRYRSRRLYRRECDRSRPRTRPEQPV